MSAAAPLRAPAGAQASRAAGRLPGWWPLAALTLLAAALRLSTLDLQSFWYDEAFTPVHVLHASLSSTLRAVSHTENSPPLWYLIAWADSRVLGTGEVALRLPSALAGIATVPVAWAIGGELAGRRAAIACAALTAVGPLFVWYSQEARVYGLFILAAAVAMLCFLRAEREPTPVRMAAFALSGGAALLTHYFAVFLLIPMVLWLLWEPRTRRAALPATGALTLVGLALLPLISAQGGHGTQWIGRWPLAERLQAIPQYYLTGASGAPLGHGVELLLALPILAGAALGLWRLLEVPAAARAAAQAPDSAPDAPGSPAAPERTLGRAALMCALIAAGGILIPVALAILGADYLAPRNLVAAMIPVTVLLAVLAASPAAGRVGMALVLLSAFGLLAITVDVDLSPRLQRGNWREVAHVLRRGAPDRAITTVELGAAPLEYYMHRLRNLAPGSSLLLGEIDETGYSPLRESAGEAPAHGFHLLTRLNIDGLIVYRFLAPAPRSVSEAQLRRHVITLAHPEVLVPGGGGK
jgi:4-amino-4-deoxy-L-arabinose transferase-like glycosyltransferase